MGIKGLIDLVKDESVPVKLNKYRGLTIVVDVSCWIHRGSYACCMELALGQKTEAYVMFCLKYIHMLLSHDIKPVLVFDGVGLTAKDAITQQRRRRREQAFEKGKELLRNGNSAAARQAFAQSVSVTPEMTQNVMKVCRLRGVDCVVAPYEADAEIAFLLKSGVAQAVITEDSDLLAFGCEKVLFKVDLNGNALEVDLKTVFASKGFLNFDIEKFRRMCILSGCDYLPDGLPGVGLKKALKVFQTALSNDITTILKRIGNYLKKTVEVSEEYITKFIEAENTFKYQLVFDPLTRQLKPLNEYPMGHDASSYPYCGRVIDSNLAYEIALGNVNVKTLQKMASFSPHQPIATNSKLQQDMNVVLSSQGQSKCLPHRMSIWNPRYVLISSYEVGVESKTSKDVSKMSAHSTVYGKPNFTNRNLVKKVSCPPLLTTSAAKEPNKLHSNVAEEERDNLSITYLETVFSSKHSRQISAKENQLEVHPVNVEKAKFGVKRPRSSMENAMLGSLTEGCSVNKRRKETENLMRANTVCEKEKDSPSKSLIEQLIDVEENTRNEKLDVSSPVVERKTEASGSPHTVVDSRGRLCIDELFAESYNQRLTTSVSKEKLPKGKTTSKSKTVSEPATKITQLLQKSQGLMLPTRASFECDPGGDTSQYVPPSKRLFKKCNEEASSCPKAETKTSSLTKNSVHLSDAASRKSKLYKLDDFVTSELQSNSEGSENDRMPLLPSHKLLNQTSPEDSKDLEPKVVEVSVTSCDTKSNNGVTVPSKLILEIVDDDEDACQKGSCQERGNLTSKSSDTVSGGILDTRKTSNVSEKKSSKVPQSSDKQSKLTWGQSSSVSSTNLKRKVVKSQYFC